MELGKLKDVSRFFVTDPETLVAKDSSLPKPPNGYAMLGDKTVFVRPCLLDMGGEDRHSMLAMEFGSHGFPGFEAALWCWRLRATLASRWPADVVTKKAILFDGSIVELPGKGKNVPCTPCLIRDASSGEWRFLALPLAFKGERLGNMTVTVAIRP